MYIQSAHDIHDIQAIQFLKLHYTDFLCVTVVYVVAINQDEIQKYRGGGLCDNT